MGSKRAKRTNRSGPSARLQRMSNNASAIVKAAAELLDEEVAAGVVTAKRMQKRFREERRVDAKDLGPALDKLKTDTEGLLRVIEGQFSPAQSKETADLIRRVLVQSQGLVTVLFELVDTASEVATQLANAQLAKSSSKTMRDME